MATAARRKALFFGAALVVAVAACGLDVTGTLGGALGDGGGGTEGGGTRDGASGGDGSSVDDAGSDAAAEAEAGPPCPPDMVEVDAGFCIDRLEVTEGAYATFLASAAGADASMPGACSFKKTHDPSDAGDINQDCQYDPSSHPQRSVVCTDWCDAKAYCEWAGKRLCGRIGGGPVPTSAQKDAAADEWYFACSLGGTRAYPYGDTFDDTKCKDDGIPPADKAGSHAKCVGGFDGLFDMSGNVLEFEDSCNADGGAGDTCRVRGGSWFYTQDTELRCDSLLDGPGGFNVKRGARFDDTGIRCCKDAR